MSNHKFVTKVWVAVITDLTKPPSLEYYRAERRSGENHETLRIRGELHVRIATTFDSSQKQFGEYLSKKYPNMVVAAVYRNKLVFQRKK